ncbi:MAG: hypothetical protein V1813_00510 [Candidatus Aenigmatarchaeota archaeon]
MANAKGLRNYAMEVNFTDYFEQCAVDGILGKSEVVADYAGDFARNVVLKMCITERDVSGFKKNAGDLKRKPGFEEYVDALRKACEVTF